MDSATTTDSPQDHRDQGNEAPPERRRSPRRVRWKRWVFLLALVAGGRLLLPLVLAPRLAERLSHILGARVEIGDVSFQPIDAIVTLRRVVVHAQQASTAADTVKPALEAKRVRIDLQWLPLWHRSLEVRELALEGARVDLDRMGDGTFSLANLEQPDPGRELPADWSFVLLRLAFRDSRLRLRDRSAGEAEPVEIFLRDAEISGFRRRATAFGRATNLHVDGSLGRGRIRIDGRYDLRDEGFSLDAMLQARNVPLAAALPYVPGLGWESLSGLVSGRLRYQREPKRRDVLSGRITLRRGEVRVPDVAEPALTIRRVVADVEAIDLLTSQAHVSNVALHGATVLVRPDAHAPIPLFAPRRDPTAEEKDVRVARPSRRSGPKDGARRWKWLVKRLETVYGRTRFAGPAESFDLRTEVHAENLGPGAYWSPLRASLHRGGGRVSLEGTSRITDGLVIEGRVEASGVDVRSLGASYSLPWSDFVRSGRAAGAFDLQLDTAATDKPALDLRGKLTLANLWLAGPDPGAFAAGASEVEIAIAGSPLDIAPRRSEIGGEPTRLRFATAKITAPFAQLTRSPEGWILPPFLSIDASADPLRDTGDTEERRPASETAALQRGAGGAAAAADPHRDTDALPGTTQDTTEVEIGSVTIVDGRLFVADRATHPPVAWSISSIEGSARALRLPGVTFSDLQLRGTDPRAATWQLAGTRRREGASLEVTATGVPLDAATPYLELGEIPYAFAGGTGSFVARLSVDDTTWRANTDLNLHEPYLVGATAALEQTIGMPLSAAVALLRDPQGDLRLSLPLAATTGAGAPPLADQVAIGLRDSIRRTDLGGGRPGESPLVEIAFPAGRASLTPSARAQLAAIGELLASRPGLSVELAASRSREDLRWLAEQALADDLESASGGFRGVLRAFGMRDARDRIRTALAARENDEPGPLDAEDQATLDALIAQRPPIGTGELVRLRELRLVRVTNELAERYGVRLDRVLVAEPSGSDGSSEPGVRAQVVIGSRSSPGGPATTVRRTR